MRVEEVRCLNSSTFFLVIQVIVSMFPHTHSRIKSDRRSQRKRKRKRRIILKTREKKERKGNRREKNKEREEMKKFVCRTFLRKYGFRSLSESSASKNVSPQVWFSLAFRIFCFEKCFSPNNSFHNFRLYSFKACFPSNISFQISVWLAFRIFSSQRLFLL